MYEVPNDWQELEEEEESDNGQELLSSYGPFSVILYARVKKLKLFDITDAGEFIESLAGFYVNNIKDADKSESALKKLKTLVSLFPSPKRFMQLLKFHRQKGKEMVFFKLAVDILTFFNKVTESPLFARLQKEVIPLAIQFYKSMNQDTLKDISNMLRSSCEKSKWRIKLA